MKHISKKDYFFFGVSCEHREDFGRILREPENSLIRQSVALLKTEEVTLDFTEEADLYIFLIPHFLIDQRRVLRQ